MIYLILIKLQENVIDGLELVEKIDSLYNSAWNKLVIVGSIAFGIIGIVMPILLQWYQRKILSANEDKLKAIILNEAKNIKNNLKVEVQELIEKKLEQYEDKIEIINASSRAKTFHLQANSSVQLNRYKDAYSDYINAGFNYHESDDFLNLRRVLKNIHVVCIPKLCTQDIEDIKISHDNDIEELLTTLEEEKEYGYFTDLINEIKFSLSKIPEVRIEKDNPT